MYSASTGRDGVLELLSLSLFLLSRQLDQRGGKIILLTLEEIENLRIPKTDRETSLWTASQKEQMDVNGVNSADASSTKEDKNMLRENY